MDQELLKYLEVERLDCAAAETLVDYYIDRELPPELELKFEAHLKGCTECSALTFDLSRIVEFAKTLDDEPLPAALSERLKKRLYQEFGYQAPSAGKLFIVK